MNKPFCQHLRALTVAVVTTMSATLPAQVEVEYFFDTDPGMGKATQVQAPVDADGALLFAPTTQGLSPGTHLLGVRAFHESDGVRQFAPTLMQEFYVPRKDDAALVTRAEYFWDEDPGHGNGTPVTLTVGSEVHLADVVLSTSGLSAGNHLLGIRAYGNVGWGPTLRQEVYVPHSMAETKITFVEYFWDDDPGFGAATPMAIAAGKDVSVEKLEVSTAALSPGIHHFGCRAFGDNGWTPTLLREVLVPVKPADLKLLAAEYFFDDDPGFGAATPLQIAEGQEATVEGLGLSVADLAAGTHFLGIRYRGPNGWSPTLTSDFVVPVSAADARILAAEYFWNNDPGFGQGTPIDITPGAEVSLSDFGIPSFNVHGDALLFVRYRSLNGWSPTVCYTIMVDAEGNYTLNAAAATDSSARNYQTLGDAVADFADRGVGADITLSIPTAATTYDLDATGEEVVAQFAALAESLDNVPSPQTQKVITFTAAEDSGNTLAITTTAEGLPAVVSALAHTATENVVLTINGTAYDFGAATLRHEEVCSGEATTAVSLSGISTALQTTWRAVPHEGTTLADYLLDGEGDLSSMTPTNSGTRIDSVAYEVTLADPDGNALATYTYYIYVHPRVSDQTFSGLTPANGASLDPGTVTLKWNAIGGAIGGYRLLLSSRPTAADGSAVVTDPAITTESITTDKTSYTLTAETGRSYSWTVTAIGRCDELTSAAMTFTGRLLPDLAVESIVMPEGAEAGNTITVQAVIGNLGEGATKETTWTDHLYYTVDSEDFAAAVQVAAVTHKGALAVGEHYEVTFTMTVPQVNEGQLRVFVVTDAAAAVMESADDNNRMLSATAATLSPFYMNAADLAALRQLYADFGGEQWTGVQWNIASELITPDNWSGVTFDTEGKVTAVNLQGRGLAGVLSSTSAPALAHATSVNLSRNTLTGDPAPFAAPMTALTSLNLSYNQIDALTGLLSASITSLDLSYQHRVYNNNKSFPGIEAMERQVVSVGENGSVALTDIVRYYHTAQNFDEHPELLVYTPSYSQLGTLTWSAVAATYTFSAGTRKLTTAQDADVVLIAGGSKCGHHSAMPATLHFLRGDANLSGLVDVNDVQRTLNYVLDSNNGAAFGLWSANTYTDYETEPVINIQDIVCTVDIVLDEESAAAVKGLDGTYKSYKAHEPYESYDSAEVPAAVFYTEGRKVLLCAEDEVAAFDLALEGVTASQVRLLLNARDWQLSTRNTGGGVRLVVFSPTGATLPVGTTELLGLGADAVPVAVQATSPEALAVKAAVGADRPTGLRTLPADEAADAVYDLGGLKLDKAPVQRGIYIVNGKKVAK